MFHQKKPPWEIGPPITVPSVPFICEPRSVPAVSGVARTFKGPFTTCTRSLRENLVEGVAMSNVAVTLVSAFSVSVQVPVPEHPPPLQPAKVEPEVGVAVRVETVPGVTPETKQVAPQLMEPPVTVPEPVPVFERVRVKVVDPLRSGWGYCSWTRFVG